MIDATTTASMIKLNKEFRYLMILGFIVLIGFLLRISGIFFSYPLIAHPDEPTLVGKALAILKTGDLNPHFFNYPSFVIYLQAFISGILGKFYHLFLGVMPVDIPKVNLYVAGRAVATIAATCSIILTYLIGKKLITPYAALFAAGLVAVSPLHVNNSYLVTVDIWTAVFTAAVLYFSLKIFEFGKLNDYILSGLFVGLSTGSKYTMVFSFLYVVTAHFFWCLNQDKKFIDKSIIIAGVSSALTFLLTTPYSLLDPRKFISDVLSEGRHYRAGHAGAESLGNHSWDLYADTIASNGGIGLSVTILAIIGALFAMRKTHRHLLIVVVFSFVFFLFIGNYKVFLRET